MRETRYTFCRICEALCGLVVTFEDGRIVEIMPDRSHVTTRGFCCIKGLKQHTLFGSPDRLKYPLRRVGTEWQRVSWEGAIGEIREQPSKRSTCSSSPTSSSTRRLLWLTTCCRPPHRYRDPTCLSFSRSCLGCRPGPTCRQPRGSSSQRVSNVTKLRSSLILHAHRV